MADKTYGSEYLLFRYRREQPEQLDAAIRETVGGFSAAIDWVYPRDPENPGSEPEGLGFIAEARVDWKTFWPTRGSQQCWDGVGTIVEGSNAPTWLLMEAKGNQPEFTGSPCGAKTGSAPRKQIESALGKVKSRLDVHRDFSWMGSYYQYANRLAALHFLHERNIPARLIFIYFTGDRFPDGRPCPPDEANWRELLRARQLTLGMPSEHDLSDRVHHVFLPAMPAR